MKRHLIFACILAVIFVPNVLADANTEPLAVDFKFAPRPGVVTKQRIVTKSVGTMKLPPPMPPMRFVQSLEQEIAAECKKVNPDRTSVLEMTFNILAARMSMMGMNLEFDARTFNPDQSDSSMNKGIGQFYSAINGSKVTGHFAPDGTLTKIVGMRVEVDRVIGELKKKIGEDKLSVSLMKAIEQMSAMFDDDTMTEQMQAYNRMVPDKKGPIRIGEKWDRQWDMNLPVLNVNCQANGQYQLVGIETLKGRPCAKIRLKETFQMTTTPDKAKSGNASASQPLGGLLDRLDFTLTSSGGDGVAYWDYQEGVLVQLRQTQRMTMEFKLKTPPGPTTTSAPEGFGPMTQEFKTSVAVDLIEGEME